MALKCNYDCSTSNEQQWSKDVSHEEVYRKLLSQRGDNAPPFMLEGIETLLNVAGYAWHMKKEQDFRQPPPMTRRFNKLEKW